MTDTRAHHQWTLDSMRNDLRAIYKDCDLSYRRSHAIRWFVNREGMEAEITRRAALTAELAERWRDVDLIGDGT